MALAAVDYGMDGSLLVNSLLDALTEAASSQPSTTFDPIFKAKPTLSSTKVIAPPSMRRTDGKYRANQLEILTAANPATFHDMILRRRGMCWRALSKQYLASRVFFMKLWIFMLVEVLELDPRRRWTGAVSPTEDSIMEEFVLFCSNRFVTWGSVMAAKTHVVEFMRSMFGVVPPPFPCTDYTLSKLKKLMAKERPAGRRTRTGFTVPEVTAMFTTALQWIAKETDATQQRLLINYTAACSTAYEKAYRGGNVTPRHWNQKEYLSRATLRSLLKPASARLIRLMHSLLSISLVPSASYMHEVIRSMH